MPQLADPTSCATAFSATNSPRVRAFAVVFAAAAWAAVLLGLAGLVLRLTVRDTYPVLSAVFYATPLVLIGSGFTFAGVVFFRRRKRRATLLVVVLAGISFTWWWQASCHALGTADDGHVKVLFWNIARGRAGWDALADAVALRTAPLIGLSESGLQTTEHCEFWRRRFPQHRALFLGHQMLLLVQGEVLGSEYGTLGAGGWYGRADLRIDGREVTAIIVDIASGPLLSRKEPLEKLAAMVHDLHDRRVVVMGDFNTPPESACFDRLRSEFRNAFETAGDGVSATWPVPLPVLALDQLWVGPQVQVHRVTHGWSSHSDHRPVTAFLSF